MHLYIHVVFQSIQKSARRDCQRQDCPWRQVGPREVCLIATSIDARFNVPIPSPATTSLSQLIATLAAETSLPQDQLKLVYKGAVLKDTALTLEQYGLQDGSLLVLVGKTEAPTATPATTVKKRSQPDTTSEPVLIDYINGIVSSLVDPLRPSIVTFISQVDPASVNKPAVIPKFEVLQREHARLSESLLRGLLELDGVTVPPEWGAARQARKDGVKRVQGELNKVDGAWGERKKL